jgi:two-component system, OmpR family, osmolarity sensor histidine kinase EnvZ
LKFLPETLFGRTAAALLAAFLLFEAAAFAVVWIMVIEPLAQRSADDMAAKIILAAQTWVELPPATRPDYEMELAFRHDLVLGEAKERLPESADTGYFGQLIETALTQRAKQNIELKRGPDPDWDWLEIQVSGKLLRVGYDRQRYALEAPLAAVGIFLLGAALTVLTALFMARQSSRRLRGLAEKARDVGQGRDPERLPETGALELRELTAAFNRMAEEVHNLLENRTVLLSGISHDLRTPITRLKLALSMLDEADPAMLARMEKDLDEMNRLISDMLAFARALQMDDLAECDLNRLLDDLAAQAGQLGPVEWHSGPPCPIRVGEAALRRVVVNLMENARRYGGGEAVTLNLTQTAKEVRIGVLDRGPGIPAEEREAVFRPFYRLEQSRNREAGGSGLGLAIVRQLVDAYGWRIELSGREGGGLAAELAIPV